MAGSRFALLMIRSALEDRRLPDHSLRSMLGLVVDAYGDPGRPTIAEAATIERWLSAAAASFAPSRSAFLSPAIERQYRADQAAKGHIIQLPMPAAELAAAISRAGDRARRGD
jgi:hypothetical protein